jgi:hypothetical protein
LSTKAVSVNRRRDADIVLSRHLLERLRNQSVGRPRSGKRTDNELLKRSSATRWVRLASSLGMVPSKPLKERSTIWSVVSSGERAEQGQRTERERQQQGREEAGTTWEGMGNRHNDCREAR